MTTKNYTLIKYQVRTVIGDDQTGPKAPITMSRGVPEVFLGPALTIIRGRLKSLKVTAW